MVLTAFYLSKSIYIKSDINSIFGGIMSFENLLQEVLADQTTTKTSKIKEELKEVAKAVTTEKKKPEPKFEDRLYDKSELTLAKEQEIPFPVKYEIVDGKKAIYDVQTGKQLKGYLSTKYVSLLDVLHKIKNIFPDIQVYYKFFPSYKVAFRLERGDKFVQITDQVTGGGKIHLYIDDNKQTFRHSMKDIEQLIEIIKAKLS